MSLRANVPRFEISQSLFPGVIIKLMEHKRNFSNWLTDPVHMRFHLTSHAVPVASPLSRNEAEQKLWGLPH